MKSPINGRTLPVAVDKTQDKIELYASTLGTVSDMLAMGFSIEGISEKTGLTIPQVKARLKVLSKAWQDNVSKALEYHVGKEVTAAEWVLQNAFDGFYQSRTDEGLPNPGYLGVALNALKHRANVLALQKRMADKQSSGDTMDDVLGYINDSPESDVSDLWKDEG